MPHPLITASDLSALLSAESLRVLDASWHLDGTNARAGFEAAHIPGARFFDLEAISEQSTPLPHMMPRPEAFAASMAALGVSERDEIVVYDTLGLVTAPRAWWMLRAMGARNVHVLDGGLPAWRAAGLPVESGPAASPQPATFSPRFDTAAVVDRAGVEAALADPAQCILDARSAARFRGEAPEPRVGLASGHMPGAASLPYTRLLTEDGRLRPPGELAAAFREAGLLDSQRAVTTCGSGVTAAVLSLALTVLGRDSRLYDGSWAEWGGPGGGPVATGSADDR